MSVNPLLKKMVRQSVKENPIRAERRKRRAAKPKEQEIVTISSSSTSSDDDDDDLEDVDLSGADVSSREVTQTPDESAAEEVDDFQDLEDVDLEAAFAETPSPANETLTFTINTQEQPVKKKAKKHTPISREERQQRKLIHKLYIVSMVTHGEIRSRWCNDPFFKSLADKMVPQVIRNLLDQSGKSGQDHIKGRKFIDGLQKLLHLYSQRFKVTCQGLVRKDWGDLQQEQNYTEKNVNRAKFKRLVSQLQGSRDIGAQGFVALLRACGVHARLVFSLQPPDFRSVSQAQSTKAKAAAEEKEKKPKSEFDPVFIPNAKREVLTSIRAGATSLEPLRRQYNFPMSKYPVFWVEAWNKYNRKWISIDPIVFQSIEVCPMRKRCRFEPPGTEKTHQTMYVLAFDRYGRVKDVTRRYTQYYNAKVLKKRIDSASDEDEHWYQMLLRAASQKSNKFQEAEILESKEFYDRDICEGIPKSKADFKNHPVYALESQLRQDEVIYPKDNTSKCGTFRSITKSHIEPIYKRSHVHRLRTAKAWHMKGRLLKMGAQPLKTKASNVIMTNDETTDDDGQVRLYADFQTELYIPPPIVDGKITKNAFGNVEIFTATMIPENGYLVKLSETMPMKLLEKAARDVLHIDYAKAIVSFDFGKKGTTTPKEGGILIDVQYKEAMHLVLNGLVEIQEEEKRKAVELNALRCWKFFLAKLRIVRRLDSEHGEVEKRKFQEEDSDEEEGYFSVGSEEAGSDDNYVPRKRRRLSVEPENNFNHSDDLGGGGFFSETGFNGNTISEDRNQNYAELNEGGFIIEEDNLENDESDGGGFIVEDDNERTAKVFESHEGGFLVNPDLGTAKSVPVDERSDPMRDTNSETLQDDTDKELTRKATFDFPNESSKDEKEIHQNHGTVQSLDTLSGYREENEQVAKIEPDLVLARANSIEAHQAHEQVCKHENDGATIGPENEGASDWMACNYSNQTPRTAVSLKNSSTSTRDADVNNGNGITEFHNMTLETPLLDKFRKVELDADPCHAEDLEDAITSGNTNQSEQLDPRIEQEEAEFGFEYSDSE